MDLFQKLSGTERSLLNIARFGTTSQLEKVVRTYRRVTRAVEPAQAEAQHRGRRAGSFHRWWQGR